MSSTCNPRNSVPCSTDLCNGTDCREGGVVLAQGIRALALLREGSSSERTHLEQPFLSRNSRNPHGMDNNKYIGDLARGLGLQVTLSDAGFLGCSDTQL